MYNSQSIDADEFIMWRAVFAFSLVDGVLSIEEQAILDGHIKDLPFTKHQIERLRNDMKEPQDVEALFNQIEDDANKHRFCELARTLVWCDGDIDRQEKEVLKRVSCIGDKHRDILTKSGTSLWMKKYMQKYEDAAYINDYQPNSLFQSAA